MRLDEKWNSSIRTPSPGFIPSEQCGLFGPSATVYKNCLILFLPSLAHIAPADRIGGLFEFIG